MRNEKKLNTYIMGNKVVLVIRALDSAKGGAKQQVSWSGIRPLVAVMQNYQRLRVVQ